jgi:glutamate synthase (NADPH/NADH) small chain
MKAEGVVFRTGVLVGKTVPSSIQNMATETVDPDVLKQEFDAVILACGAEQPRELDVPGADLQGVCFAMEYLCAQNKRDAGEKSRNRLDAAGKRVVIIGGGDTGSDCVGVANRQKAASILQFDRNARLPDHVDKSMVWPYWPKQFRTSSSQEEGCDREFGIMTKRIEGKRGKVEKIIVCRVEQVGGTYVEIPGSEYEIPVDMVILAMGFSGPAAPVLDAFGVEKDMAGNALAKPEGDMRFMTSVDKVFAAGDVRRGQSLVVWALHEGRECAEAVDRFLTEKEL